MRLSAAACLGPPSQRAAPTTLTAGCKARVTLITERWYRSAFFITRPLIGRAADPVALQRRLKRCTWAVEREWSTPRAGSLYARQWPAVTGGQGSRPARPWDQAISLYRGLTRGAARRHLSHLTAFQSWPLPSNQHWVYMLAADHCPLTLSDRLPPRRHPNAALSTRLFSFHYCVSVIDAGPLTRRPLPYNDVRPGSDGRSARGPFWILPDKQILIRPLIIHSGLTMAARGLLNLLPGRGAGQTSPPPPLPGEPAPRGSGGSGPGCVHFYTSGVRLVHTGRAG